MITRAMERRPTSFFSGEQTMGHKKGKKAKQRKSTECSRCTREGEAFYCFKKNYVFDVDMARAFVSDGRESIELEPEDVNYSVDRVEINEGHLAHVDPSIPGIVAHLYYPADDGTLVHAHRLIDGHHRASRCRQDKMPFYVYVLSEEESIATLIRSPEGSTPEHLVGAKVPVLD
ncbi:hypothetical protein [Novipirellula sp.]|uniref:hypothetical protein n=1 Tax=Novipirellula sp. TaxID=2795430 RepID=UPI00356AB25D